MKKPVKIAIAIAIVLSSALIGFLIGNNLKFHVVGVYHNDSWNGKEASLILNKDGSCEYPSGGDATWKRDENQIIITVTSTGRIMDGNIQEVSTTSTHICEIVNNGLVLHGHFFERLR